MNLHPNFVDLTPQYNANKQKRANNLANDWASKIGNKVRTKVDEKAHD